MSNEYVTQSSKCKYVVDSLAIVIYQILNWWNKVEFFCAPVVEGMVQHQEYTCWDHCYVIVDLVVIILNARHLQIV